MLTETTTTSQRACSASCEKSIQKRKIANSENAETRKKRHSSGLLWQNNSTINRVSGKAESKIKQLEVEA